MMDLPEGPTLRKVKQRKKLDKLYLMWQEVKQDKELVELYLTWSAAQGNIYA